MLLVPRLQSDRPTLGRKKSSRVAVGGDAVAHFVKDLKKVAANSSLKQAMLLLLAHSVDRERLLDAQKAFNAIDTSHDGVITSSELLDAMVSAGVPADKATLHAKAAHQVMDVNQNGVLSFSEFLAATLEHYISKEEVRTMVLRTLARAAMECA